MTRLSIIALYFVIVLPCSGEESVGDVYASTIEASEYYNLKQYNNAITKATKVIEGDKYNAEALLIRAHSYAEMGDYGHAISDYEVVAKIRTSDPRAFFFLGVIWGELGNSRKAINYYTLAIQHDKKYVDAIVNRGWMYLNDSSTYDKARNDFEYAADIELNNPHVLSGMAELYVMDNEILQALNYYDKAINTKENDYNLHYLRAGAYMIAGKFDRAIGDLDKAISVNPMYWDAYIRRGNCYAEIGDKLMAVNDYSSVINSDATNITAYNNRAYTYYELGEYADAVRDYSMGIKLKPDMQRLAEMHYERSKAYMNLNKYENALDDAKMALKTEPDNLKYEDWYEGLQ
ncbi:MAG: tetratricopeptide repeat protein [Pseudomonadota bacterium]